FRISLSTTFPSEEALIKGSLEECHLKCLETMNQTLKCINFQANDHCKDEIFAEYCDYLRSDAFQRLWTHLANEMFNGFTKCILEFVGIDNFPASMPKIVVVVSKWLPKEKSR